MARGGGGDAPHGYHFNMAIPRIRAAAVLLALILPNAAFAKPQTKAEVQALLWAKEQSIYTARGHGDLKPYIESAAKDYAAWPPFRTAPAGMEGLNEMQRTMKTQTQEKLEMHFISLALSGAAAVIYYQTHRTMLPDGTPTDERFDVTHTWAREGGTWKVLGGMARARKP